MKEVPYHNDSETIKHIGGKMIRPGETRMVDASMLPNAHERNEQAEAKSSEPTLIDGTVAQITAALPGLSDEELAELKAAEEAGNTRKGVMNAIAEEELRRAEAKASGDADQAAERVTVAQEALAAAETALADATDETKEEAAAAVEAAKTELAEAEAAAGSAS